MKFVSIVLLSAAILCAQNLSKLGFTGSGGEDLVAEKILGRWYALEGNYIETQVDGVTNYRGPNSLRLDRPLPPSGVRVIREVAKLDVRAEDDPNYIPRKLETDAITVFAGRAIMHHKNPTAGPIHGLRMPSPDPASLYASEADLIAQRIAADRDQSVPAWPDTVYWEIGNEPNLSPWLKPSVYADIYKRYYQGIKSQSPEAKVGVSLHDNDIIQQELNYFVNHTIRDSLEKRLSDTLSGVSVEQLEAAGILTLGAAGGAAGGPIGAVLGLSVGAFGSMIIDAALTDGERDTRNAVKRMYQQYGDNWDEYAQKSTRLYFRSVLQALPENTAPDFIGLHTYPIDLVKKQGLAAMQDDIDELVTGLQLEWVERFAPGDLARLQAMVSANVRADLTAEEVMSFQGVRNVPPVLITEFGNISPETVALRDVKDTFIIQRGMGSTFSDPDLAGNFDGSTLFLCTRTMYGRSSVQLNDLQTDYGEIALMNKEFGKLKRYGTVSSSARLSMLMDMQNYSGGQGCSIMEIKNYEFNSSYAKDLTLSMIDRFNQNPNIHAYLLYKPENTDTKFESFGLTPAYSRLFHDLNTTVRGNILVGTPCNDLNDLGQELFKQETGFSCRGTLAKRSFASFTQPVWTSEAKVEPSITIRPTGTAQALWVGGEGYRTLTKTFTSTEVRDAIPGANIAVDIFIPNAQKNPWWVGDVQLYWNAPSANVYNQYLGRSDLTQLPHGNYSTISFSLPGTVQNLLANLPGDVTFTLALNGDGGFALDNFRFLDGQPASFPTVRATERILAMDNVDDWTSENAALRAIADREGVVPPVLHVSTNGWMRIASAEFDQSALKGKNAMQVDVLIPEGGNAYWSGDLAASLNCPDVGAYSVWLGRASFQNATEESWQTMEFMIPESISQIDHPSAGCRLFFDLNANGTTKDYQLDRVRFVNRATTLALGN